MADIIGPLRPSDSWSCTEVRSLQHTHVWTVKGFSQCECRYLETSVKPVQSDTAMVFRVRLHPQGNKESNKDFTFFQVFSNNMNSKYRSKFSVYNSRNEEIATTIYTGTQQLHGYFEYIRRDLLLNHIQPSDELQLVLTLTITFDTVTKSSTTAPRPQAVPEAKPQEVARDLESFHRDRKLADFMIICGDTQLPAHKAILAARSPVFAAMLEPHTEESQNNLVQYEDIEPDVMEEILHFIYSGKSPNLSTMASDLLAVADRFALTGLKDMADQVLRGTLMFDSVCRILVLADMHGARDLRAEAVKFIAQNSSQVIETDGWREMLKKHPELVTEVVSAITSEQQSGTTVGPSSRSSSSSTTTNAVCEPSSKRVRVNGGGGGGGSGSGAGGGGGGASL